MRGAQALELSSSQLSELPHSCYGTALVSWSQAFLHDHDHDHYQDHDHDHDHDVDVDHDHDHDVDVDVDVDVDHDHDHDHDQYLSYRIDFLPHSQSDTDLVLELEIELCRVGRLIDSLCSRQAFSGA